MTGPLADLIIPAAGSLIRWGIIALLGVATLAFGGMTPWAGAVVVLIPFGLFFLWLLQAACAGEFEYRPTPLDVPLGLFLGLILLQLVLGYPLRLDQADLGQRLLRVAGTDAGSLPFIPGTLDYHATRWSLLFFLAYVACFVLVIHTLDRREHVIRLLTFIVGLAGATGLYGLLEYLSGNHGVLGLKPEGGGRVRGTFVNPDHFGAFMAMSLFAGIGLLMALGTRRRRRARRSSHSGEGDVEDQERRAVLSVSGRPPERLFQQVLILFVLGLVGTTLIFTMSRGAIVSVLLAGAIVAATLAVHESLGRRRLLAVAAGLVIGGLALWIGLGPVLDRFGGAAVGWSERLIIYKQAWNIVRDFPVLGAGFGTFGGIFPRYQAPPLAPDIRFSYAHSDLLQLLTDGGAMALAISALGLWAFFREVLFVRVLGVARPAPPWGWRFARALGGAIVVLAALGHFSSLSAVQALPALGAGIGVVLLFGMGSSLPPAPEETPRIGKGLAASVGPARNERNERSARRRDAFNIGITVGGVGALAAILIHSIGDFSLRIPANALLLAVLLAATLQAARVRFHTYGPEPLSPVVVLPLRGRVAVLTVVGAAAILGWLSWIAVAATVAESRIAGAVEMKDRASQAERAGSARPWVTSTRQTAGALSLLESAVRLDATNSRAHLEIGRAYEGLAFRAWNAGVSADGRLLPEPGQRAEEARRLMAAALVSFARAAYLAPMEREVWGEIGWAHGTLALTLAGEQADSNRQESLAAFRRGMALRPGDPYPFQLQAEFAFQWAQGQRGRLPAEQILASDIYLAGVQATRRLIELQPNVLPGALDRTLLFSRDFGVIQQMIPPHAPDFLFAARLLADQGLSGPSRLALERAVTLAPDEDRPIFYRYLAEDSIEHGDLAEAIRLLEFVQGLDPQNPDIRIMLGDAFTGQKEYERAQREYEAAVEAARRLSASVASRPAASSSPSEPLPPTRLEIVEGALRERGLLPAGQGEDALAKALAALAGFHQRRGGSPLAIPLWEQAIARAPRDPRIHYGYGESLDSVGAWIAAQGEYRKALELDPGNVSLRLRLADKYMGHGLVEQAIALWQEVGRIRPGNVEAHVRLADVYDRLGRRSEAEVEYDQILRLDPGSEAARQGLARLRGDIVQSRGPRASAPRVHDRETRGRATARSRADSK